MDPVPPTHAAPPPASAPGALESVVGAPGAGMPLLAWLTARFRYHDADAWRAQLAAGRVRRNGAVADGEERLAAGDRVAYTPAHAAAPDEATVPVLFADDELVAVDKPPFRVVQAASAFAGRALLPALAQRFPPAPGFDLEPVHRLDRETSGVLLLARTPAAFRPLQQQFATGSVHKEYVAVARGVIAADALRLDGAIGPARHSDVAARRAVVAADQPGARPAVTEVTVLQRFADCTLVHAVPRTGRTHQIRVHLEHLGHALVGDKLYGQTDARYREYVRHLKAGGDPRWPGETAAGRLLLHAQSLDCIHPQSGAPLRLRAPWPADLRDFVAAAGRRPN